MRFVWVLIAIVLTAGGVIMLAGQRDYRLSFSEDDLRTRMAEQMPFAETYLGVLRVTLDNPRFDLVDGSDRLSGGLDVEVNVRIGANETPLGGAVDISGALRYARDEGAFYLDDPRVERVQVEGLSDRLANRANSAISYTLAQFYKTRPVYVLSDDDVRQSAAKMLLKDVIVEDEKLVVTLGFDRNAN